MTVTITPDTTISTDVRSGSLWRTGAKAGATAAVATAAIAGVAHALGVSFEAAPGNAIPLLGFAQLTLVFTAIGIVIARSLHRRARHPRSAFLRTTVALTVLSVVPDVTMSFDAASKLTLILTHVAAAAIVIPALCSQLDEDRVG
jgi:hypothetical protein